MIILFSSFILCWRAKAFGSGLNLVDFFFFLGPAAPVAYRSSWARGGIRAAAAGLPHSNARSQPSACYMASQGNAQSLNHGVRPGVEPMSLWILVRFVN